MASILQMEPRTEAHYEQLSTKLDDESGIFWCRMNATPRPCFNPVLLGDLEKCLNSLRRTNAEAVRCGEKAPVSTFVLGSTTPGVFSLGGDLSLFRSLISSRDVEGLRRYAQRCVEEVYLCSVNLEQTLTTVALVQGEALGGGFEAALACSVLVAEKQARFGFPEILFNLFPGMGAYNFLARRVPIQEVERIIGGGKIHSASDMADLGIVDIIAEDGRGEEAVREFVTSRSRQRNGFQALSRVRQRLAPVSLEALRDVADIWVEAALGIEEKDLALMERLVRLQDRRRKNGDEPKVVRESAPVGNPLYFKRHTDQAAVSPTA